MSRVLRLIAEGLGACRPPSWALRSRVCVMLTSGVRLHENFSLRLFACDALMPGTADLRILGGRRVRGDHQASNGCATLTARSWPAAEIDSKSGKLSAATFAEFASDRFAALCWAGAIGHKLPLVAFAQQSVERLLHTKTCRTGYACNSANAAVASLRHGRLVSSRYRPLLKKIGGMAAVGYGECVLLLRLVRRLP